MKGLKEHEERMQRVFSDRSVTTAVLWPGVWFESLQSDSFLSISSGQEKITNLHESFIFDFQH